MKPIAPLLQPISDSCKLQRYTSAISHVSPAAAKLGHSAGKKLSQSMHGRNIYRKHNKEKI